MGVSVRPLNSLRMINLDWMLITVALMALALLAASLIRSAPSYPVATFGAKIGGLRALGAGERLVLFEDLSTSADPAWSHGQRDDSHIGLGAIWLARNGEAPMTRRIALPAETARSIVTLDLIAIDAWALQWLEIAINGTPVLRQSFSAHPDLIADQQTEILTDALDQNGIILRSHLGAPQELGFATGPGLAETRLSLEMAIATTAPELRLSITALPAVGGTDAADVPLWAIDNFVVIAANR
ncbi:hypothetical protein LSUCC0031_01725 [Rhodobacterales bacterium LSUCC0031]|nr:hypothetical protein [Rhodobacterales bacterium LSUCC0031]